MSPPPADRPAFTHCGSCGAGGVHFDGAVRFDCTACGWVYYKSPVAAVVGILWIDGRVLLTRRARDPGRGLLDLPGGFVDPDESAEEALGRELAEELFVTVAPTALDYVGSIPNVYPYRGVEYRTADLFFQTELAAAPDRFDLAEIVEVTTLDPREIDLDTIALASVREGVSRWVIGGNAHTPESLSPA